MGGRWKGSFIKRNISIFAINLSSTALHTQMVKIFSHKKCISDIRVHLRRARISAWWKISFRGELSFVSVHIVVACGCKKNFFWRKLIKTFTALHSCSSSLSHTLEREASLLFIFLLYFSKEIVHFEKVWKVNNSHERQQRDLINEKVLLCFRENETTNGIESLPENEF